MALREALVDELLIAEREHLGLDRWDECWSGVYVMSPPPRQPHQRAARRLADALETLRLAEEVDTAVGVGDARDYRVPDVVVYRSQALDDEGLYVRTALVVVEVLSPGEEPYAKLAFYEAHAVDVLLCAPDRVEIFSPGDAGSLRTVEPVDGWLVGRHIAVRFEPGRLAIATGDRSIVEHVDWP